jgi:hypothetical protein
VAITTVDPMQCFGFAIEYLTAAGIGSASRLESFMLVKHYLHWHRFHLEHAVDGIAVPISIKLKANVCNFSGESIAQLSN